MPQKFSSNTTGMLLVESVGFFLDFFLDVIYSLKVNWRCFVKDEEQDREHQLSNILNNHYTIQWTIINI